jgi:hypothetical protein
MKIVRRRLAANELDAELLWLGILGVGGLFAVVWLMLGLPTPHCLFRAITGVPCLTCGGTRCARFLLAGHPDAALGWNPLVFAGIVLAAVFLAYAAAVVAFSLPRLRVRFDTPREADIARVAVAAVAVANWIYLIFRFSRHP